MSAHRQGRGSGDARRYLGYLRSERDASQMYRALAELTTGERREALEELAGIEDRHAAHWAELLESAGVEVPPDAGASPGTRRIVERARQLSLDAVLPELESAEREAQGEYDAEPDAMPGMADDERKHAEVLAGLADKPPDRALTYSSPEAFRQSVSDAEPWHRADKSGSLRAAVFGVSDGLVSNTALVMGFAGAGSAVSTGTVLFAGFAGLLAGAFSMGAGEFVSVSSQRDLFTREIALEARELREKPEEEQRELELLYRAKGLDRDTARQIAARIMSDPDTALDTLAREELGLDPDALGSPVKVAASSFLAFTLGAIVPVVPYLFLSGSAALTLGIVLATLALLAVGGTVGALSGAGVAKSAIRQFLVGGGAAALTFLVGHFVGGGIVS